MSVSFSQVMTIEEALQYGLDPDPCVFRDVTDSVPNLNEKTRGTRYFGSRMYFVSVTEIVAADGTEMTWLSLRRNDRNAMQDWRHLQRIKNNLCGEEREAVQIYPAESRLIDESNQIHLWVYPEGHTIPFGYKSRSVVTALQLKQQSEVIAQIDPKMGKFVANAKQRPFDQETERESGYGSAEEVLSKLQEERFMTNTLHRVNDEGSKREAAEAIARRKGLDENSNPYR